MSSGATDRPPILEPVEVSEFPLRAALDAAEPKPDPTAERSPKKNYAQRLSNALAQVVADALRPHWPSISPDAKGRGQEARVRVAASGMKRLDVKVTDPTLGLLLSVSIKTYSFQDYDSKKGLGRFTKNVVRNDHELRGEASVLHQRQPYSVVVGVLFTPIEAALDGVQTGSSFAHMVQTYRKRAGRGKRAVVGAGRDVFVHLGGEDPRFDLCERMFIGLYESQGERRGHVRFVDVERPVPQRGLPREHETLSFQQFAAAIEAEVTLRNELAPDWSDADEADE